MDDVFGIMHFNYSDYCDYYYGDDNVRLPYSRLYTLIATFPDATPSK
jgi:hypothetical protein